MHDHQLVDHLLLALNNAVAIRSRVEFMSSVCSPLGAVSPTTVVDGLWTLGQAGTRSGGEEVRRRGGSPSRRRPGGDCRRLGCGQSIWDGGGQARRRPADELTVGRAGGTEIKAASRWTLAGVAIDGREWRRRRGTLQGALVKGWAFSLFFQNITIREGGAGSGDG
jgi:hypothetical protein